MPYPNLPEQRLIVNGVDLSEEYGMVLVDGYSLGSPEYETKTVEITGVETIIDLTESLIGDVMFKNRTNTFNMYILYPVNFESTKNKIFNFLHGKRYDYRLSFDPDYTYNGRFSISSCNYTNDLASFSITVDSKPYKYKETQSYSLNAYHGKAYYLPSGRKQIRPVIECDNVCYVFFDKKEYAIPAGTHTLNKVLFKEGQNEIYFNSKREFLTTWDDFKSFSETVPKSWSDLNTMRWDEIYVITEDYYGITFRSWNDLETWSRNYSITWEMLYDNGYSWKSLNSIPESEEKKSIVYVTYEWGDL